MNQNTQDILAADTTMGTVTLKVADLDRMIAFYRDGVGLDLLGQDVDSAILGRPGRPSLILQVAPELRHAGEHEAGLYHTAFLFAEKADLAAAVYSVAQKHPSSFTGSSDHFVSNAFYFDDPEGNGVELYWDTERKYWEWNGSSVRMGTVYLDPNLFLQENLTEAGATKPGDGDAGIGHVHLKVGDIPTAKKFYVDTLGFEPTFEYGSQALFVSAGGYHHHVGMNTWHSSGAGTRTPALGLGQVSIEIPTADDLGSLRERLAAAHVQVIDDGNELRFDDPWANLVRVHAAA
ncbi:catechol 2,3-dioxygenase [Cryobacterium mesophilum]|uniref:VOC family protein n=1 Tax=Terrimesophilobacter mesophilus TaxID=433647 RepID=A0A4R8VDQ6_9MICO|nr:VOC family protein [Terrimesophilobacter mesophilus]MBB5633222.1 catechol 2,3-dioxygenase [Terrimesophilobacter mesophilus]TFB79967.1 VOC family protein [Terrimesophilobacter mesophilus]